VSIKGLRYGPLIGDRFEFFFKVLNYAGRKCRTALNSILKALWIITEGKKPPKIKIRFIF
jgi:hypothetical protein